MRRQSVPIPRCYTPANCRKSPQTIRRAQSEMRRYKNRCYRRYCLRADPPRHARNRKCKSAMSLVQSVTNGSTEVAAIYGILSPAAGAQTVTVNWGSSAVSRCGAVSVTGGDLTTLVRGTSATNTGSSTTPSVVQTSDAVDLVFAVMVADDVDGLPITAGSGVDARWGLAAFTAITSWGVTKAGAASVTANGTMSAFRPWGMVSCSIKGT